GFDVGDDGADRVGVDDVELAQLRRRVHELAPARGQVVDDRDLMALGDEPVHQVRADEAGSAGDDRAGRHSAGIYTDAVEAVLARMSSTAGTVSSIRSSTRIPWRSAGSIPPTAGPESTTGRSGCAACSSASARSASCPPSGAAPPRTRRSGVSPATV